MTAHKKYTNIDEWKAEVETSSHIYKGETVEYVEDENLGSVSAYVVAPWVQFHIGSFCIREQRGFKLNHGWFHP